MKFHVARNAFGTTEHLLDKRRGAPLCGTSVQLHHEPFTLIITTDKPPQVCWRCWRSAKRQVRETIGRRH